MQQYFTYEKEKHLTIYPYNRITVFTVFFGLWDLLEFATFERDYAMQAIDDTIAELFYHLERLALQQPFFKVIIPRMVDVTFLPRFQASKSKTRAHFAETQHLLVFLWAYWNTVLLEAAAQWDVGQVFILDLHTILMEQVRLNQLQVEGLSNTLGVDRQLPMFENVVQPCLSMSNRSNLHAAVDKCVDPAVHLFW